MLERDSASDLNRSPPRRYTIVFVDIEGSTKLTEVLKLKGDRLYERELRDRVRERLFACVQEKHGRMIQSAGDGQMFFFEEPEAAIYSMAAFQKSLHDDPVSFSEPGSAAFVYTARVRIGIHESIKPLPLKIVGDKVIGELPESEGGDINYASRVTSLASGGQILLSEETPPCCDAIPHDHDLQARPEVCAYSWPGRRVRDFDKTGRLVREILYHPDQAPREPGTRFFPRWYVQERNLYIEREGKEAELYDAIRPDPESSAQIAFVIGGGGRGKTRFAAYVVARASAWYPDGVYLVELAFAGLGDDEPAMDAESARRLLSLQRQRAVGFSAKSSENPETFEDNLVEATARSIGEALKLPYERRRPEDIIDALSGKAALVILDNFESVACAETLEFLGNLVYGNQDLCLVITSRLRDGFSDAGRVVDLSDGMTSEEGIALYTARANRSAAHRVGNNNFVIDRTAVASIVEIVNNVPLAIELVAAGRLFLAKSDASILADLEKGMPVALPQGQQPLDTGHTARRHLSMEHTHNWSWNLLRRLENAEDAQALLAACSLLAGSFSVETAAKIVGWSEARTHDALVSLILASLIRETGDKYSLHRDTRLYGGHRLAERADTAEIRERFCNYFLGLANKWGPLVTTSDGLGVAMPTLLAEADNIESAIIESLSDRESSAVTAMTNLNNFTNLSSGRIGKDTYDKVRAAAERSGDILGAANCVVSLGDIALRRSDHAAARVQYEKALPMYEQVGDILGAANCVRSLGDIALARSDHATARVQYEKALPMYEQVGDILGAANCVKSLGNIALARSDHAAARVQYEKALPMYEQVGAILGAANCVKSLGDIALERSDHAAARLQYEKALPMYEQVGAILGAANCVMRLGDIALERSDHAAARLQYEKALPMYEQVGAILGAANCVKSLGDIALERSDHAAARLQYEKALPMYEQVGDILGAANCVVSLGDIALARSDHAAARVQYEKALDMYGMIPEPYSMGATHRRLSRLPITEQEIQTHRAEARRLWASIDRQDLIDKYLAD